MDKIICDICGTSYQESAECCPICGCSKDSVADLLSDEVVVEETAEAAETSAASKKKEIFDFDEVNAPPVEYDEDDDDDDEDEDDDDDYDEEDDEDDEPRHNTFVVILLTILIFALLAAAGFIFVRYFLPNMTEKETVPTTVATQSVETTAATEATVPCEYLSMTNVGKAELNEVGQLFLLHVQPNPENTTDKIVYTSGDEAVATVTEDGKVTAVGEGETVIYISCGKNSLECPVVVKYVEETVPPTTEAPVVEETVPATEAAAPGVNSDVTLKLKKSDVKLGVYYYFTLELDCELEPSQVEWSSEHPHIAKVDENGVVTALQNGTTAIIAKYGDQQVQCIVRCG